MPSFSNTIKTTIDVVTSGATAGVKSLRQEMASAEGAAGKMKVGFGKAGDFIKAHAAAAAVAVGTTLVAAGAKAVAAFNELALEAGRMGEALGIGSEAASRWIEVAGDLGVEAGAVEKAMLKMERAVADTPASFAELGIEVARTNSGAVDANETFIRTVEALKRIADPTKRAQVGTALLGKGYAQLAEIIGGDVRGALASVADAKVIDPDEVEKARNLRDAMDELRGKLEDLALTVGGALVPVLSDLATETTNLIDSGGDIGSTFADGVKKVAGPLNWFRDAVLGSKDGMNELIDAAVEAKAADEEQAASREDLTYGLDESTKAMFRAGEAQADLSEETAATAEETAELNEELQDLTDTVNSAIDADFKYASSLNSVEDAVLDVLGKTVELNEAQGADRVQALEDLQRSEQSLLEAYVAQSAAAVDLWEKNVQLAGGTLSAADANAVQVAELEKVRATTAPGSALYVALTGYIDKLRSVPTDINTTVNANTAEAERKLELIRAKIAFLSGSQSGGPGSSVTSTGPGAFSTNPRTIGFGADGAVVTRPTFALIGEAGPEAVVPLNRTPGSSPLSGGGGVTINLTVQAGMMGEDIPRLTVEALTKAVRSMGASTVHKALEL